jgi:hypothetical protein
MIQRLEEKEVDFDDDSDSSYIRLQRYRERFCKVHEKLCELTGDSVAYKVNRRRIAFSGTDSSDINRFIEKFVNKTGQFPDFHDILSLVKSVQSDVNIFFFLISATTHVESWLSLQFSSIQGSLGLVLTT